EGLLLNNPSLRKPQLVASMVQANPKTEFLTIDLSEGSADLSKVQFPAGLSPEDRKAVLADLKASQRVYALTDDVDDARTLIEKKHNSAVTVARLPLETFQAQTGLPIEKARQYHDAARAKVTALTVATTAALDIWRGGFDDLEVSNAS